jgi:SAM-dependent methyltransferase
VVHKQRHLDIGCGSRPRNPYGCEQVYAVDISPVSNLPAEFFRAANLTTGPIPFEDNFFYSLSAYDFLEHVPRVFPGENGATTFPFVALMNEIWRVLQPNGRFYAITPAYPHIAAFSDPTHVNVISEGTHGYFTDDVPGARIYGFKGRFRVERVEWIRPKHDYEPLAPDLRHRLRRWSDKIMNRRSHLLWEFSAIKP